MTPDELAAVIADEHTGHAREDIEARYVTRGVCPDCERELVAVGGGTLLCETCETGWFGDE